MAKLIYAAIASLDGYVEDERGNFEWAAPDDEVHAFVNDLERSIGTYLYGRRMYETMLYWETASTDADQPDGDPGLRARSGGRPRRSCTPATLQTPSSARTRIEREFEPGRDPASSSTSRQPTSPSAAPSSPARAMRRGAGRRVPSAARADHGRRRQARTAE